MSTISTILDHPSLTGRYTQRLACELMIQVIEDGLRRYGW